MAETKKTTPANIIAIIAFVLLVVIAIWSGIQIVKFAPRIFSGSSISDLFKSEPNIELQLNKVNLKKGDEFDIKWNLSGKVNGGAISFMYKCTDGIVFDIYDDLAKKYKTLPCNSPFNMPLSSKSMKLKVKSADKNLSDVALAIVYTNAEGKKYKDIKKVSVSNPAVDDTNEDIALANTEGLEFNQDADKEGTVPNQNTNAQEETNNNTTEIANNTQRSDAKNTSNKCTSKVYGKPDLSIHHLKIGSIVAGQFVQKSTFYRGETIVVKFTVSNFGTKTSPSWYFQALLPNRNGEIYTSKAQPAIAPCNGRFYTLKVANPKEGTSKILVNIDPHNLIKELNEINNSAKAQITVY